MANFQEDLVSKYFELKQQEKEIKAELDEIKELLELTPKDAGKHVVGNYLVSYTRTYRISEELVLASVPDDILAEITKLSVDTKKAREVLSPADIKELSVQTYSLSVKEV